MRNMAQLRAVHKRQAELLGEMERAVAHELSKDDRIEFGHREYRTLLRAYEKALKDGAETFKVELKGQEREFLTTYAYYLLEYLHGHFGSDYIQIKKPPHLR